MKVGDVFVPKMESGWFKKYSEIIVTDIRSNTVHVIAKHFFEGQTVGTTVVSFLLSNANLSRSSSWQNILTWL